MRCAATDGPDRTGPDRTGSHPQPPTVRFIAGVCMFFAGMAINIHSDYTLLNLRKPGETGYKIPRGATTAFGALVRAAGRCTARSRSPVLLGCPACRGHV